MIAGLISACEMQQWNNPYPDEESGKNILYSSFAARPKHLDPAQSYSSNEVQFTAQIYEPPLQYHYLKRPYQLEPLAAEWVPVPIYYDAQGNELDEGAEASLVAKAVYEIKIKPGIHYQPHPAFVRTGTQDEEHFLYHDLNNKQLGDIDVLGDFAQTASRELTAADYVYQIKRLAHPKIHSPIFGLMIEYIDGLFDYSKELGKQLEADDKAWIDLRNHELSGVEIIDRYTYRITLKAKYPQFQYWLAMPFFAPIPWEVDRFYTQPGLTKKNITLDWYPVGTGPYMLTVNNPNRQMILERNPNFRGEAYPSEGEPGDKAAGLLVDAGKTMPFIDKVVFSLEKEGIPYWNKFLQGYYDSSGVASDSFDQAVNISGGGDATLTSEMTGRGIDLLTTVATSTYYGGFNMLDPVVGGYSERARLLRRAIAIALDYEEFISIFNNGRGIPGQGPIPPGIFGHEEAINPYVYESVDGRPQRKSIEAARALLAQAGYPDGVDEKSGEPLLLYYDTAAVGPEAKATLDWWRKQFRKLNLQLVIRSTDYNRFQQKMRDGKAQIFSWGWNADYPDPENFLFLLYGPNKKAELNGENAANYINKEFDALFEDMKNLANGPERASVIKEMIDIARKDGPWLWGFHPKVFSLQHAWLKNTKPADVANNTLKYKRVDPVLRDARRAEWNSPILWPLYLIISLLAIVITPAFIAYKKRQRASALSSASPSRSERGAI
ncbi:MAG: ABC transporter substrate-binding protein [Gammaproteobacteria bacterium]|nr:ABC transporter substrate-binding protein [Gammaproteobacteria bacterium]